MKWIILIIIGAALAFWLYQGRRKNNVEDPDMKTFEEKDYYLRPGDDSSGERLSDDNSSDDKNPRH
ncbi:hypothetical protein [Marinobacter sp. 2_MG-2023]|uniref:hypothetical protein n=1 Tax=Marinobacter sp. 2_MG-2023 TaxID=3062679 RepID=UPI0026E37E87|nr:hypothetical protein [Marinobacter sp. 2_MG-2023]MDO6442827.1 hypothetical protein [Marinobacter sp. 2_MG-2023]